MPGHSTTTPAQAWAILTRHARDEIAPLRLQELCRDNDRVSSLVAVYNTTAPKSESRILIADLSRQRMTLETLTHLLKLASATHLRQFITQLAWGQNDPRRPIAPALPHNSTANLNKTTRFQPPAAGGDSNDAVSPTGASFDTGLPSSSEGTTQTTGVPSMHVALRVPAGKSYQIFLPSTGENALTAIHHEWYRIEQLADRIRSGQTRGVTGAMIRDIVVIGGGVPLAALHFCYTALRHDERAARATRLVEAPAARIRRNLTGGQQSTTRRRLHLLTRVDPVAAAAVVADLDPACTVVISIALNGNEISGLATKTLKSWLLHALLGSNRRPDQVLAKHMMLVTGNDHIASVINKPESVHIVSDHSRCEAFTTFTASSLLVRDVRYCERLYVLLRTL
jgi:glucose-6-phosphate isomerase